jgi:hypothetical protein
VKKMLAEHKVTRAADRKKLREPLKETKDNRLQGGHARSTLLELEHNAEGQAYGEEIHFWGHARRLVDDD